jgi:murein L,D-transpeptidase YcbB/YkuD
MQAIQATIKPEDTGPAVANLYAALHFLIDEDAFSFIDLSELNPLKDQLRSEEPSGFYKGAAVQLVVQLKVRFGLGDEGIVDEKTADALNALLKKFGAFGASTDFVLRSTVKDTHKRPHGGLVVIAFDRDHRRW